MDAQIITTPAGERLVLLPEAEFVRLVTAGEDADDRRAVVAFRRDLETGQEELVPALVADRILAGESRIRVWREYRGLSVRQLADKARISPTRLARIESGDDEATISTMRAIADALSLMIEDVVV